MYEIDAQSRRLGEVPTRIYYTPEWPFGRYTHPAGGRFIREYGRTSPLPETLAELERPAVPAPAAPAALAGEWLERNRGLLIAAGLFGIAVLATR